MAEDESEDNNFNFFDRFCFLVYGYIQRRRAKKEEKKRNRVLGSEYHISQVRQINETHREREAGLNDKASKLETQLKEEQEKYTAEKTEEISGLTQKLEAAEANYQQEKARAEELGQTVGEKKTEIGGLQKRIAATEKEISMRVELQSAQAEKTKELLARLVLSERIVADGTANPVVFLDSEMRVIGINTHFTKAFQYELADLTKTVDVQEGLQDNEAGYSKKGRSVLGIIANRHNLKKLEILNQYFYPRSRDSYHYEICLRINPKTRRKKMFGFSNEEKPGDLFMAYTTVAIYDGQFIGASLELNKMSRSEMKKVGVDYILNRDAEVTVGETINRETAEEYRKILTSLYTHDLSDAPLMSSKERRANKSGRTEAKGGVEFDFINTKTIDEEAINVFREMYDFCKSQDGGHLSIYFSNLNADLRNQLFDAGISVDVVHGIPKEGETASSDALPDPAD